MLWWQSDAGENIGTGPVFSVPTFPAKFDTRIVMNLRTRGGMSDKWNTGHLIPGRYLRRFWKREVHPDLKSIINREPSKALYIYRDKDGSMWVQSRYMWMDRAFETPKIAGDRLKKYIEFMESL